VQNEKQVEVEASYIHALNTGHKREQLVARTRFD
jgi:hypothetical protein